MFPVLILTEYWHVTFLQSKMTIWRAFSLLSSWILHVFRVFVTFSILCWMLNVFMHWDSSLSSLFFEIWHVKHVIFCEFFVQSSCEYQSACYKNFSEFLSRFLFAIHLLTGHNLMNNELDCETIYLANTICEMMTNLHVMCQAYSLTVGCSGVLCWS